MLKNQIKIKKTSTYSVLIVVIIGWINILADVLTVLNRQWTLILRSSTHNLVKEIVRKMSRKSNYH